MTFEASPLHQHTTRRGPYHRMCAYEDFYGGKARVTTPGRGSTPLLCFLNNETKYFTLTCCLPRPITLQITASSNN